MVVGMHDAIGGISIDIVGKDLERIGMGIHSILLAVVDSHSAVRCHHIARFILIVAILAGKHILVDNIGVNNITKGFRCSDIIVPNHTVTHKTLTVVGQDATIQEM